MKEALDGINYFDFTRINQQRQQNQGVQETLGELVNLEWSQHGLPDRELPGHLPELEHRYQQAYSDLEPLRDRKNNDELLRDTPKGQIFQEEIAHHLGPSSLLGAYLQLNQEEQHYLLQQRHKQRACNNGDLLKGKQDYGRRYNDKEQVQDLAKLIYTTKQLHHVLTHDHQNKTLNKEHFGSSSDLEGLHKYYRRLIEFKNLPNHSVDDAVHLIQQTNPEATKNYQYRVNLNDALQAYLKHQPKTQEGPTTPQTFLGKYNLQTGERKEGNLDGAKFTNRYKSKEVRNFQTWLKNQYDEGNLLDSTWQELTQTKGWQNQITTDGELSNCDAKGLTKDLRHYIQNIPRDKALSSYLIKGDKTSHYFRNYPWLREKREQGSISAQTWNKLLQTKYHEGYKEHFYQLETRPAITPWPVTVDDAPKHSRTNQIRNKDELQTLKHLINGNTDQENLDLATKITYNNTANAQTTIDGDRRTKGEILTEDVAPALGPTTLLLSYLELDADQQTYLLQQRQTQIKNDNGDPLTGNKPNYTKRYNKDKQVHNLIKQNIYTERLEKQLEQRTPRQRQGLNLHKGQNRTPFRVRENLARIVENPNIEGFVKNIERRNPKAVKGYEYQPLLKKPEQENPNFTELYDNVLQSDTEPALI